MRDVAPEVLKVMFMSRLSRCLLWVITIGLMPLPAIGQTDPGERAAIEVINIEHRDPATVRTSLYPVLDPRGSIGQIDNKLVIATTAANLAQIKSLVRDADIPRRRLVVSVNFDHGTDALAGSRQQSVQALEGDQIRVTDDSLLEDADPPTLLVLADIRDNSAHVSFQLENVGGFTGRYTNILPLGVWYVINPQDDSAEDLPGSADLFDPANVLADIAAITAEDTDIAVSVVSPIALRVDVLP